MKALCRFDGIGATDCFANPRHASKQPPHNNKQQTTKQQPRQPKAEIKQLEREEADLDARLREADARLSRIAAIAEAQAKLDAQLQVLARAAAEQNAR